MINHESCVMYMLRVRGAGGLVDEWLRNISLANPNERMKLLSTIGAKKHLKRV